MSRELPVAALGGRIADALRTSARLILRAPTGSGKSTQLPRILLRHGFLDTGIAVVLQPRRLAARLLAARVAAEEGGEPGGVVGYRIRLDARVSARTRVEFVTEGILLRRMVTDPELRGVAVLVFDEFHERHLHTDVALGWALHLQETRRPDLRVVVMSATLDTGALQPLLEPCAVIETEGRAFPVDVRHADRAVGGAGTPVWDAAADAAVDLLDAGPPGHVLVFMPGGYEIARTLDALRLRLHGRDVAVHALHGEMPPAQQDAAVAPGGPPRVIVATNVAETSITIDGVTGVVDSGLARIARDDPARGISTLHVEKISRASADQRAGRAGRTAPGRCVRLWTERDHAGRPAHDTPEVRRVDLAEVTLLLRAAGVGDLASFRWVDPPDPRAVEKAETLLADLGALERPGGPLTDIGRRLLAFPLHPRFARLFVEAERLRCVRAAAAVAALAQGRPILLREVDRAVRERRDDLLGGETRSDFARAIAALAFAERERFSVAACQRLGVHAQGARQAAQAFQQLVGIAERAGLDVRARPEDDTALRRCILAGFADQVARRLDRGTLRCELVHKRRGLLARESAVQDAELLVVTDVTEIGRGDGEVQVLLGEATAIEPAWLEELFPGSVTTAVEAVWDAATRRVVAREVRRYRDLVLSAVDRDDVPEDLAGSILAAQAVAGVVDVPLWDERVDAWLQRVAFLRGVMPELGLPEFTEDDRRLVLEDLCVGARGAKDLRERDPLPVVRSLVSPEQQRQVDRHAPERWDLPSGRKARITYAAGAPPTLASRLQDFIGMDAPIAIAGGRVRVRLEFLAPNGRAVQVTETPGSFWRETYPALKNQLQRRYPRHVWP